MTSLLQTGLNGHLPAPPEKRFLIINTSLSLPYFPAASCQTNEICMNNQEETGEIATAGVNTKQQLQCIWDLGNLTELLLHCRRGKHAMISYDTTIFIDRPQQDVWPYVSDLVNYSKWQGSAQFAEWTSEEPPGVGSTTLEVGKVLWRTRRGPR